MGATPASAGVPKSIAESARKFSSALQQRYPVDIGEFRRIMPEAERSPNFRLASQAAGIQNHKTAVIALCKFVSGTVARESSRENPINEADLEGFLRYFGMRASREDLPFYQDITVYLSETRYDFALARSLLFTRTGHQQAFDFLFSFSKGLREACRGFVEEAHPNDAPSHHLGHAAVVLEEIFELDILRTMYLSAKFSEEETGRIRDAGKLERTPPSGKP